MHEIYNFVAPLKIVKLDLKFKQKPWKIEKEFHILLSWQDQTDYLEYLFMFKEIVPASFNIPLLKAGDKINLIHFSFKNKKIVSFLTIVILFRLKKWQHGTGTAV